MWQVDDLATADLMTAMYGGMAHGLDIATALRNAQAAVRSQLPHPYYWAGFGLFGSWRGRLETCRFTPERSCRRAATAEAQGEYEEHSGWPDDEKRPE